MVSGNPASGNRLARRHGRRSVDLDQTFAGTGSLSGTLTPDVYDALRLAINAAGGAAPYGSEDDRSAAQRRHDALGAVASHYLAHAELPAAGGERPRVVVTIDRAALSEASGDTLDRERWATLDGGLPVPPETARRLACDAQLLPVAVHWDTGALALGRTTRVWSQAIRRTTWIRDHGTCAFPGCRRTPADLHHLVWWSNGGRTDLHNAAWLGPATHVRRIGYVSSELDT